MTGRDGSSPTCAVDELALAKLDRHEVESAGSRFARLEPRCDGYTGVMPSSPYRAVLPWFASTLFLLALPASCGDEPASVLEPEAGAPEASTPPRPRPRSDGGDASTPVGSTFDPGVDGIPMWFDSGDGPVEFGYPVYVGFAADMQLRKPVPLFTSFTDFRFDRELAWAYAYEDGRVDIQAIAPTLGTRRRTAPQHDGGNTTPRLAAVTSDGHAFIDHESVGGGCWSQLYRDDVPIDELGCSYRTTGLVRGGRTLVQTYEPRGVRIVGETVGRQIVAVGVFGLRGWSEDGNCVLFYDERGIVKECEDGTRAVVADDPAQDAGPTPWRTATLQRSGTLFTAALAEGAPLEIVSGMGDAVRRDVTDLPSSSNDLDWFTEGGSRLFVLGDTLRMLRTEPGAASYVQNATVFADPLPEGARFRRFYTKGEHAIVTAERVAVDEPLLNWTFLVQDTELVPLGVQASESAPFVEFSPDGTKVLFGSLLPRGGFESLQVLDSTSGAVLRTWNEPIRDVRWLTSERGLVVRLDPDRGALLQGFRVDDAELSAPFEGLENEDMRFARPEIQ